MPTPSLVNMGYRVIVGLIYSDDESAPELEEFEKHLGQTGSAEEGPGEYRRSVAALLRSHMYRNLLCSVTRAQVSVLI